MRSSEMNDWLKTSHSSIVLAMMCSASFTSATRLAMFCLLCVSSLMYFNTMS
ncbi:Uncharacterised protein [Segatella copri]|nr:Uncharacterised protein [Segatella copri]